MDEAVAPNPRPVSDAIIFVLRMSNGLPTMEPRPPDAPPAANFMINGESGLSAPNAFFSGA